MAEITDIKNEDLKEFLPKYYWYQDLSEEEKQKFLTKVANQSEEKQAETYEFIARKYQQEKLELLTDFYEKMSLLEKRLFEIQYLEKENKQNQKDSEDMANLLDEMDNV